MSNIRHVRRLSFAAVMLLVLLCASHAHAHDVRPAFLALQENGSESFSVLWKRPINSSVPLFLEVALPEECRIQGAKNEWVDQSFSVSRWVTLCDGGLVGKEILIEGLDRSLTDVLLRIEFADGRTLVERLTPDRHKVLVTEKPGLMSIVKSYFLLGVEHILGGIDHLLFLLCMMLLVTSKKKLLLAVTAFTVAHSLTLVAATLGYVRANTGVVEVLIALSIMLLAYEIVRSKRGISSLTVQYPWVMIFVFGLMHGLGFAGALSHVGLPEGDIPLALLFFNVGVEVGQLLFIAAVLLLLWLVRKLTPKPGKRWANGPAYVIGVCASFWFFQRLVTLWS